MQAVLDEIIEKAVRLKSEDRQRLIQVLQVQENKSKANPEKGLLNGKKNPSPNIEWLKAHRNEVAGKYVALEDGQLLAHGRTLREVDQEAKRKGAKKPLLTYVPRENEELWAGW